MYQELCIFKGAFALTHESVAAELIDRHQARISRLARAFAQRNSVLPLQEFEGEARFGLWKAIQNFKGDPVNDANAFGGFAETTIANHLKSFKRSFFKRERALAREESRTTQDSEEILNAKVCEALNLPQTTTKVTVGNNLSLHEQGHEMDEQIVTHASMPECSQALESNDQAQVLSLAVKKLSYKEQVVIRGKYFQNKSTDMIAREAKCSLRSVSVYEKRALQKIRKHLPINFRLGSKTVHY
jgi:RNA polymerase sigma factor (sigma-70 family)